MSDLDEKLNEIFEKIKEQQLEFCKYCSKSLLECDCKMAAIVWVPDQPYDMGSGV